MSHFFDRATARLFGSKLAEDARYRPKVGGDIDLLKENGQGVIRGSQDNEFSLGPGAVAPAMTCDIPASAFDAAPMDGDRLIIGGVAFVVRTPKRSTDRLVWTMVLGETS